MTAAELARSGFVDRLRELSKDIEECPFSGASDTVFLPITPNTETRLAYWAAKVIVDGGENSPCDLAGLLHYIADMMTENS